MAITIFRTLEQAKNDIKAYSYARFSFSSENALLLEEYGKAKWAIVDMLNEHYSRNLNHQFDLYNWLYYNEGDEVAYFLNEAGANAWNHSELKKPFALHLWIGAEGFIIGVEQQGKGFNPKIEKGKAGGGFGFFEKCKSVIFFNNPQDARMVLLEWNGKKQF